MPQCLSRHHAHGNKAAVTVRPKIRLIASLLKCDVSNETCLNKAKRLSTQRLAVLHMLRFGAISGSGTCQWSQLENSTVTDLTQWPDPRLLKAQRKTTSTPTRSLTMFAGVVKMVSSEAEAKSTWAKTWWWVSTSPQSNHMIRNSKQRFLSSQVAVSVIVSHIPIVSCSTTIPRQTS